ncbi:MAG: hypothetical protein Q7T81_15830 [Pseudolabrys sp.]|nr:hypothetical protein [Pseudolabrys sp.]
MPIVKPEYLERELKRWARPDARNFVRPDWQRFVKLQSDVASVFALYERKYRADQARAPGGSREGGRWVDEGGNGGGEDRTQVAGRISKSRAEQCEFMHRQDLFICRATQNPSCYQQAYLRYSNCISGRQIPPLNF